MNPNTFDTGFSGIQDPIRSQASTAQINTSWRR
jgi:hypothetical protein